MRSRKSTAIVVSPPSPTIIFWVVPDLLTSKTIHEDDLIVGIIVPIILSYLSFFLLGLPYLALMRKKKSLNSLTLIVGGAILGALAGMFFTLVTAVLLGPFGSVGPGPIDGILWGAVFGCTVFVIYGFIAGWPNNSFKPKPLRGSA